ncbi:MAG TPA: hypothetical protein VLA19_29895 [Herpetosiphonaceae bacterium]|nr:hypothetical protein [Herpetosiphonaceae bacterium]
MLEAKDIVGYAVPLLIALGGWIFAWQERRANNQAQQREERASQKRRKLDKVSAHIDAYADLVELYRLYARRREYIVQNSDGSLQKDAAGNYVVQREVAQPEERFAAAVKSLDGSDLNPSCHLRKDP